MPGLKKLNTEGKKGLKKRTLAAAIFILLIIPGTLWAGMTLLGDRKYYFISLMIIFYTIIPFFMIFEGRKPQARELIIIAALSAIAVAGRAAFFMLPQFKPIIALVIISGICFGGEAGFLTGAVSGFVSNFFAGQGPWTPWQMFCFGIIGFIAGVLHNKGLLKTNRLSLCVFGALATLFIYGGIINGASVLMFMPGFNKEALIAAYIAGLGPDLIHAFATVFFLFIISQPLLEKLERIKTKYGILS